MRHVHPPVADHHDVASLQIREQRAVVDGRRLAGRGERPHDLAAKLELAIGHRLELKPLTT
jgi:hypothetical protein